ncbi:MAG: hypothetical protein DWQ45_03565 [Planctomycetota bacterium]|nr:MAG: hypothetical protein DWQ29_16675 [Planctomycetota bacterium]REK38933.1 MAG: hypothetical protein DWQ45_03565 [Planctomycetota bacterium]
MAKKKTTKKTTANRRQRKPSRAKKTLLDLLELRSVRLLDVVANVHVEGKKLPSGKTEIRVESGWGINTDEEVLLANVTLLIEGSPPDGGSTMSAVVTYQAIFDLESIPDRRKTPQDEIDSVQDLAIRIVWPYLREFAQSLTARMGLPPMGLPLIPGLPAGVQSTAPKK